MTRHGAAAALCAAAGLLFPVGAKAHDCVVTDWALARKIVNGAPADRARRFDRADKRVFAYVRLNCTRVEGPVAFRFARDGKCKSRSNSGPRKRSDNLIVAE